jgi:hypothetical protein
MKFVIVDTVNLKTQMVDSTYDEACAQAGLSRLEVDHGALARGINIVVFEFGLMQLPSGQRYFQIGDKLFAGNAVLYGSDSRGETISMPCIPAVIFFSNADEVERAICKGQVRRPATYVNKQLIWEWHP